MVETVIRRLEQAGMVFAAACVTAIMLVTTADAVGRYLLDMPLSWATDVVTNYLMVAAAYLAVAATYQRGDHININLVHARLSPRARAAADITVSLMAAVLFAAMAWGATKHGIEAYKGKEFYPGVIMWPVWLSFLPIPFGCVLMVLRLLHHSVTIARQGEDPHVETEAEEGGE